MYPLANFELLISNFLHRARQLAGDFSLHINQRRSDVLFVTFGRKNDFADPILAICMAFQGPHPSNGDWRLFEHPFILGALKFVDDGLNLEGRAEIKSV